MKFITNKEVLVEKLQILSGPTVTKQNFPILNSVLINSHENKLKLTTTDLDTTIITFLEADIKEKGEIAIPMKRFISIIKELPFSDVSIESTVNNLLIKCEKVEFKLNILNAKEFPNIEEERKTPLIKIDAAILERMIRLTSFCVGYEDNNYVLNGIFFELHEDDINLIATDGKRLSFITNKLPATQPEIKTKISFILPIRAVNELYKLIKEKTGEIFLFVEENKIGFDFKTTQFIARPIEGEFPNYSQYIPKENKEKLKINRQSLLTALKRADLLSTQDYRDIKLDLKKDGITVLKTTPQLGEAKEVIGAHYNGPAMCIGFNPLYLIDVLRNLEDEDVEFEFFGTDKPAVLRKENYTYLTLPIK